MKEIEQTESFEELDNLAEGLRGLRPELDAGTLNQTPQHKKWKSAVDKLPKEKKKKYYEREYQKSREDREFLRKQMFEKEIRSDTQIVHFWLGEKIVKEKKLLAEKDHITETVLSQRGDVKSSVQNIGVPEIIDIDYSEIKDLPIVKNGGILKVYKDGFLIVRDNNPKSYQYFEISDYEDKSKRFSTAFLHTLSFKGTAHYYLTSSEAKKLKNHKNNLNLYFVFKKAYKNKAFKITLKNHESIIRTLNISAKTNAEDKQAESILSNLPPDLTAKYVDSLGVLEKYERTSEYEKHGLGTNSYLIQYPGNFSKEIILKAGYYFSIFSKFLTSIAMIHSLLKNSKDKNKDFKDTILNNYIDLDPEDHEALTKAFLENVHKSDLTVKNMIPFIEKNIVSERFTLKKDTISLMQVTRNIIDLIISYLHTKEGTSLPITGKIDTANTTEIDCFHYWNYINTFNLINGCLDKKDFPLLLDEGKIFNEQKLYKHVHEVKKSIAMSPFRNPNESFDLDPETKTKISEILKEAMEQTTGLLIPYNACVELLDDPVFKYIRFIEYEKYIAIFAHDQNDRFISEMYVKGEDEFRYWLYNSGQVFDSKVTESSKYLYLKLASSIRDWKVLIERDSTMKVRSRPMVPHGVKTNKKRWIYLPRVTYKHSTDKKQRSREKIFFSESRKFSGDRRAHRRKLRSGMKASKLQMLLASEINFYVPDGHTFVKKSVWGKVKMGEREIRYRNKSLNGLFYASDHEIEKAKEIHELSPAGFEERSEKYVAELGWEVTKRNNYDGGIDIRALKEFKDGTIKKLLVQCKHWKKPVGHDVLHALVGAAADEESKYEKVLMVITSSKFTTGAIEYAHNHSITLVRGDDLLKKEA